MKTDQAFDNGAELPATLKDFFERYPERTIERGESFIQAGDEAPVFLVAEGRVVQYYISDKGDKLSLNIYGEGDVLPLSETMLNIRPTFYAEASEQSIVRLAPRPDFYQFIKTSPEVLLGILGQTSRDEQNLKMRLASAMEGGAESRVLQELIIIKSRLDNLSDDICVTETVLSAQTGLARETVNRALKRLSTKGVIRRPRRGCIELVDQDLRR